jgi:phage shock protein PspC (stress-responsive transcriptional regulator)
MMENRDERPRLVRIKPKRILGGVCAGFAYWLGWPTWILRVLLVLLVVFAGSGILAYILLWIFMPAVDELPSDYDERTY